MFDVRLSARLTAWFFVLAIAGCEAGARSSAPSAPMAPDGGHAAPGGTCSRIAAASLEPFTPPPLGCALPEETDPVLEMPRDAVTELYLDDPARIDRLVFDYLVVPRPRVVAYRVDFDFDRGSRSRSLRVDGECPKALPIGALTDAAFEETVVSAKVVVEEAGSTSRASRVSFARGTRTLTLLVPAGVDDAADDLFVLFEPAAGASRVALSPARIEDGAVHVEGLPAIAGTIALIRSPLLEREGDEGVTYAPEGFGAAWRLGVVAWYGAFTTGAEPSPLALEPRVLDGEAIVLAGDERVALGPDRPVALVALVREATRTELDVPCGPSVTIVADGVAALEVTRGGEAHELGYGEEARFDARCAQGASGRETLLLEGRALTGRKAYALARLSEAP
jgi:hypothetical protein